MFCKRKEYFSNQFLNNYKNLNTSILSISRKRQIHIETVSGSRDRLVIKMYTYKKQVLLADLVTYKPIHFPT